MQHYQISLRCDHASKNPRELSPSRSIKNATSQHPQAETQQGLFAGIVLLFITAGAIVFSLLQKRKKDKLIYEKEKEIERVKRQKVEQDLEFKKKELTAKILQLARKNEFLGSLEEEIKEIVTGLFLLKQTIRIITCPNQQKKSSNINVQSTSRYKDTSKR